MVITPEKNGFRWRYLIANSTCMAVFFQVLDNKTGK